MISYLLRNINFQPTNMQQMMLENKESNSQNGNLNLFFSSQSKILFKKDKGKTWAVFVKVTKWKKKRHLICSVKAFQRFFLLWFLFFVVTSPPSLRSLIGWNSGGWSHRQLRLFYTSDMSAIGDGEAIESLLLDGNADMWKWLHGKICYIQPGWFRQLLQITSGTFQGSSARTKMALLCFLINIHHKTWGKSWTDCCFATGPLDEQM